MMDLYRELLEKLANAIHMRNLDEKRVSDAKFDAGVRKIHDLARELGFRMDAKLVRQKRKRKPT